MSAAQSELQSRALPIIAGAYSNSTAVTYSYYYFQDIADPVL